MTLSVKNENMEQVYNTLNELPIPIVFIVESRLCYANEAAKNLREYLQGQSIDEVLGESAMRAKHRLAQIQTNEIETIPTEYELKGPDNSSIYIEATAYPLDFLDNRGVMVIARDITERNSEEFKTESEQQQQFLKGFNNRNILFETLYIPATHIGGDFYYFETLEDGRVIGVLGDVNGKGTAAAMMISSFEVLFRQAVEDYQNLKELVLGINTKFRTYFPEKYVAAIFFCLDIDVVSIYSCGINHFQTINHLHELKNHNIQGPFIGMFSSDMDMFDMKNLTKAKVEKIIFYTDGLEFIQEIPSINCDLNNSSSLQFQMSQLDSSIKHYKKRVGRLKDDIAVIAFDFGFKGIIRNYKIYGIQSIRIIAEKILEDISLDKDRQNIKLVLYELATNAYKHGNKSNNALPIDITVYLSDTRVIIKVADMSRTTKHMTLTKEFSDPINIEESGRGLSIVMNICNKLYYDQRHTIAEYELGGKV